MMVGYSILSMFSGRKIKIHKVLSVYLQETLVFSGSGMLHLVKLSMLISNMLLSILCKKARCRVFLRCSQLGS